MGDNALEPQGNFGLDANDAPEFTVIGQQQNKIPVPEFNEDEFNFDGL